MKWKKFFISLDYYEVCCNNHDIWKIINELMFYIDERKVFQGEKNKVILLMCLFVYVCVCVCQCQFDSIQLTKLKYLIVVGHSLSFFFSSKIHRYNLHSFHPGISHHFHNVYAIIFIHRPNFDDKKKNGLPPKKKTDKNNVNVM